MVSAIAEALGLRFSGPSDPRSQLIHYLCGRQVLLLLDNLEHLLGGIEWLRQLLGCSPGPKLLVTSRERLDLCDEWVFEVHGLPVPAHHQVEGLESYSAVELFVRSARRAWLSFELTAEERPHLVRICQLVEGMPLALELAAGWVRVLSCQQIAQEIERNLDILATRARDAPERHRSLRAAFDHSWRLLSEDECRVLRRLSIFRGGFRREAAQAIAGGTLPLLASLVGKSLLYHTSNGRYDLHELVRQYAWTKLEEAPAELEGTRDLHSAYYTDFVAQRVAALQGERLPQALAELGAETENVREAWRWAVTHGQVAAIQKPIKGLWCFHEICGWFQEGEATFRWAAEELDRHDAASGRRDSSVEPLRAYLRATQGWFCVRLGRFREAQSLLRPSAATLRLRGAHAELVYVLHHIGVLELHTGNHATARALFLEQLASATRVGDPWGIALAHGSVGLN
jgi:predicted ATPase